MNSEKWIFISIDVEKDRRLNKIDTPQGTNISPQNGILKMMFPFPRWDMLIPWRV